MTSEFIGALLGKGHITKDCRFKYIKKDLLQLKSFYEKIQKYCSREPFEVNINGYKYYEICTLKNKIFNKLRYEWYPYGIKKVPNNLFIDNISLEIWFNDNVINKFNSNLIKLNKFDLNCCDILIKNLNNLGIKSKLIKYKSKLFIQINDYEFKPKIRLNKNIAHQIRNNYNNNDITQAELANIYGVSQKAISKIVNNISYKNNFKKLTGLAECKVVW